MRRSVPGYVCALALLGAGSIAAYVPLSPNRTWSCTPDYTVDNKSGGIPSINDADGGATAVVNAITSWQAWNGSGSATVVKAHKGSVAGLSLGDGKPMLAFSDPIGACTGSCLAATFLGYYGERSPGSGSWQITDADIVINAGGFHWTSEGEDPGGAGCSSEVYLEGVAVHEVGHGLGLAHSGVAGATMSTSGSLFCNNSQATTEADDESGIVALYGMAPCFGCTHFTNYLAGTGTTQYQPCGTFYQSAGMQDGYLRGPDGTDFDLALWHWNGSDWTRVATSASASSSETIHYSGLAGWFRWEVYSYTGSGTYHFWKNNP